MTGRIHHRFFGTVLWVALVLSLLLHGSAIAGDFSKPWSAVQSNALTRTAPDGASRQPFATVTTSFFQGFILLQPPDLRPHKLGTFDDGTMIPHGGVASGLAVADFNQDGVDDFAVADFAKNRVDVYLARRDGTYARGTSIDVGRCPVQVSARDVDGDGRADISALSYYDRTVSWARGEGGGRFARTEISREKLGVAPILSDMVSTTISFDTLENAVKSTKMSATTRQALLRYLARAEKAYGKNNNRRTGLAMQGFINYLQTVNDPRLKTTSRDALILMAKELLDTLFARRLSVDLTASPETVAHGESSTLSWTSFNAVEAAIDEGVGTVPVNGTTAVSPSKTTTYTITVKDSDGLAAIDSQVVKVTGAVNAIYVDATNGDDTLGDGSMEHPYKTITKGLSQAAAGVTVFVAEGLYNIENGDTFPLVIPAGVTLQGDGSTKTIIVGAGEEVPPAAFLFTVQMNPDSTLDSIGLYSSGALVIGISPASSKGALTVQHCRVVGQDYGILQTPMWEPLTPSLDVTDCIVAGCVWDLVYEKSTGTVSNSRITSAMKLGLMCDNSSVDVTGSVLQGSYSGVIMGNSGATGLFRSNSIVDNIQAGVFCISGAHPDFGTSASNLGNNTIRNLNAGASCNLVNADSGTLVFAVGNTWDHDPPWTDFSGTFLPPAVDIMGDGPNVKWQ